MYIASYIGEFVQHILSVVFKGMKEPFAIKLKREVIRCKQPLPGLIKKYRSTILNDRRLMQSDSHGAGTGISDKDRISVADYARRTAVNAKRGILLYHLVSFFKPRVIIEMGTSLGMSSVYLAHSLRSAHLITVEGNIQLAEISSNHFRDFGFNNIELITGNFDDVLPELLKHVNSDTLVFIDGNHTYEATKRYVHAFSGAAIVVLDDIRWSMSMMKAWEEICKDQQTAIFDLYSMGILFPGRKGKISYAWI